jgi:hypothetical protein
MTKDIESKEPRIVSLGFTGSRQGMSAQQKVETFAILAGTVKRHRESAL